jgi:hypothetical protein
MWFAEGARAASAWHRQPEPIADSPPSMRACAVRLWKYPGCRILDDEGDPHHADHIDIAG